MPTQPTTAAASACAALKMQGSGRCCALGVARLALLSLAFGVGCSEPGSAGGAQAGSSGSSAAGGGSAGVAAGGGAGASAGGGSGASAGSSGASVGGASVSGGSDHGAGAGGGPQGGSGASGASGTAGGSAGGVDVFGIEELYPSAASGAVWTSQHWDGEAYTIDERTDANDPLGLSGMRGEGTLAVNGEGELVMGGSQPRIYVYPGDAGPWKNLEITVYYQRVADSATAYAGLVIGARSGPEGHTDATSCEAHTYYARIRNDGAFDFEKELKHPASSTQSRVDPATAWPPTGQVPFGTWIGFKFVIYNLAAASSVQLEAYRDLTNGANGGTWEKVNETVDAGGWFVASDCAEHAPNGDGESELVVVDGGTAFIRNTEVTEARYRWLSVREIAPP